VLTVGRQIGETLRMHQASTSRRRGSRGRDADFGRHPRTVRGARISDQLSGGMRQRVMIAMALACNPKL